MAFKMFQVFDTRVFFHIKIAPTNKIKFLWKIMPTKLGSQTSIYVLSIFNLTNYNQIKGLLNIVADKCLS